MNDESYFLSYNDVSIIFISINLLINVIFERAYYDKILYMVLNFNVFSKLFINKAKKIMLQR